MFSGRRVCVRVCVLISMFFYLISFRNVAHFFVNNAAE